MLEQEKKKDETSGQALDVDKLKKAAAEKAVEFVESGMVLGLGGGSTAAFAIRMIGAKLQAGELHDICGVPCSLDVEAEARRHGIPITSLQDHPVLDLTIDGADEVDGNFNLIKGGGAALVREKVVAQASRREIIIVDERKTSPAVGTNWPIPVEILPFGLRPQMDFLEELGAKCAVRRADDGQRFVTDNANNIVDCDFGPVENPRQLGQVMKARVGIIDHGLFIDMADDVIVAGRDGIRHLHNDRELEKPL